MKRSTTSSVESEKKAPNCLRTNLLALLSAKKQQVRRAKSQDPGHYGSDANASDITRMSYQNIAAGRKLADQKDSFNASAAPDLDPSRPPLWVIPCHYWETGWTLKRPRGRTKAEQYQKLVKHFDEALAACARAEVTHASIADRGLALDASRDILDDRAAVVPVWGNVKRIVYNNAGCDRYGAGA
eukprot:10729028-Heterocapsa_arctica.AAC.1